MRLGMIVLLLAGAAAVSGCDSIGLGRKAAPQFELPYKASLAAAKDGLLSVTVKANGAGLDAVRESARYEVTQHCMARQGNSDADWVLDAATGDWAQARTERGELIVQARCRA